MIICEKNGAVLRRNTSISLGTEELSPRNDRCRKQSAFSARQDNAEWMNQRIHTIVVKLTPIRAQWNFGVALFNQSLMLAAVRSTSCHAGGKPTGYVSLMDKKGEKGGKKRRRRSESAGCVDQRNRKTAETLILPTVANCNGANWAKDRSRIERKAWVLPGAVRTAPPPKKRGRAP